MITNPVKLDPHCFSLSSTTLSLALVNHSLSVMSSMQIKSNQRVPCWRHQPGCSAGCSASPRRCHTQKEPTQKHAASCPTGRQTHPRCLSSELAETHTSLVSQLFFPGNIPNTNTYEKHMGRQEEGEEWKLKFLE